MMHAVGQQLYAVCIIAAVALSGKFTTGECAAHKHLGIILKTVICLIIDLTHHCVVEYSRPYKKYRQEYKREP